MDARVLAEMGRVQPLRPTSAASPVQRELKELSVARHPRNVRPCYPRDMLTSKEAAHKTTVALILALIGLLGAYSGLLAPLVGFMLLAAGSLPGDID